MRIYSLLFSYRFEHLSIPAFTTRFARVHSTVYQGVEDGIKARPDHIRYAHMICSNLNPLNSKLYVYCVRYEQNWAFK